MGGVGEGLEFLADLFLDLGDQAGDDGLVDGVGDLLHLLQVARTYLLGHLVVLGLPLGLLHL